MEEHMEVIWPELISERVHMRIRGKGVMPGFCWASLFHDDPVHIQRVARQDICSLGSLPL